MKIRFPEPTLVLALFCGALLFVGLLINHLDILFTGVLAAGVLLLMVQGDKNERP